MVPRDRGNAVTWQSPGSLPLDQTASAGHFHTPISQDTPEKE